MPLPNGREGGAGSHLRRTRTRKGARDNDVVDRRLWAYGEHNYGDRAAPVKADDWEGPSFGTCANAASVCRRFETSSRDEVVAQDVSENATLPDDAWRRRLMLYCYYGTCFRLVVKRGGGGGRC